MFKNRNLVIATKHQKEKVMAPILETEMEVKCLIPENFDSDSFGTFSGEIERKKDAVTTAREKCLAAMELTNCDLGIASEGSFGPHPSIFIANADDEFLILIDKKNDLEIIVRELSLDTNFGVIKPKSYDELVEFAKRIKFPSHALNIKTSENDNNWIKGIQSWESLRIITQKLFEKNSEFIVETDMRALNNPTRMQIIRNATLKLVKKMKSNCPNCSTPGFGIHKTVPGLPCQLCKNETKSTLYHIYQCKKCNYELEKKFPNNKLTENPMYCDYCNP